MCLDTTHDMKNMAQRGGGRTASCTVSQIQGSRGQSGLEIFPENVDCCWHNWGVRHQVPTNSFVVLLLWGSHCSLNMMDTESWATRHQILQVCDFHSLSWHQVPVLNPSLSRISEVWHATFYDSNVKNIIMWCVCVSLFQNTYLLLSNKQYFTFFCKWCNNIT